MAAAAASRRGIDASAGGVFYAPEFGLYGVGFVEPERSHGVGGVGVPWLYVDGNSGAIVAADVPRTGTAGDIFMQAQFPLQSGRIIGLPGRILASCLGLVVAMLAITGIVIWTPKRTAARARIPIAIECAATARATMYP